MHVQSWYVAARSEEVRRGRALTRDLFGRRVALFRGQDGGVRALDARCAHLGADLGQGTVVDNALRCPFHHWTYDGSGRCVAVPSQPDVPPFARTFSYPVEERHGAVFLFNGPRAAFPLPSFEAWRDEDLRAIRLPPRRLRCHPHLAVANGLDVEHYRTVHGLDFVAPPVVEEPDEHRVRIRLALRLRPQGAVARALRMIAGETFAATFTTWGASMATIEGAAGGVPLLVLFTHRLEAEGGSASQTFLFQPRRRGLAAMLVVQVLMAYVLSGDRHVLERVQFHPCLVAADAPLAAFIRRVNAMPADRNSPGSPDA
ncbi:MAG TPA: Rieske (2Fe-2S) protein [Vicinamibacteria bacterium]|nr:Rieske (2Fe-2S) protein [Vicinamibacteria bacterium]